MSHHFPLCRLGFFWKKSCVSVIKSRVSYNNGYILCVGKPHQYAFVRSTLVYAYHCRELGDLRAAWRLLLFKTNCFFLVFPSKITLCLQLNPLCRLAFSLKTLVGRQLIPLCRLQLFPNFSSVSFITCESISFFHKFYQCVPFYLRVAN